MRQNSYSAKLYDLDPDNLTIRKELADVLVNTGEPKQGLAVLAEFVLQRPQDPNAKRALGELQFSTGHFAEADKSLSSLGKVPAIQSEIAVCRLLEGDATGADAVFDDYLNARQGQNDQFAAIGHAVWLSVKGDRDKAITALAKDQFPQPDLRALALSQIAIWKVEGKDVTGARQSAAQAVSLATAQVPKVFAAMASLLANGDVHRRLASESTSFHSGSQCPKLRFGLWILLVWALLGRC